MHSIFGTLILPLVITLITISINQISAARTFTVDYDRHTFLKDGEPFRYISGTLHYFQIPHDLWRDRMTRVRALGCNVLQTYTIWSRHQPTEENTFNFARDNNLTEYLALAQEFGFQVILRIGPYIDAEMDMGGFPYWLLKNKDIQLRSSKDNRYLKAVENWLTMLYVTVVKPMLYQNGGPIIMVQIENEYGYGPACDGQYMMWMRDLTRRFLGEDVVLITTDPATKDILTCANVPQGVLPTIDFGASSESDVTEKFTILRQFLPKGPLVNSEFYPAWMDIWGNKKHVTVPSIDVTNTMRYMWNLNVTSFNIYPAHGGTNWGYSAGSQYTPPFQSYTTEYDFDAPISEAGDITQKFLDMRKTIEDLTGRQISYPIPPSPPKYSYGRVRMEWMGTVLDLVNGLVTPERVHNSTYPLTMEELDQAYGFVIYETTIPKPTGRLQVNGVHDRAYVLVDGQLTDVIQRNGPQTKGRIIQLSKFKTLITENSGQGSKIQILVENQGRVCFGVYITDRKGLLGNVTLNDEILTNWTMYPIDLSRIYKLKKEIVAENRRNKPLDRSNKYIPSIYYGYFLADPKPGDTYFNPSGWGKGQLLVNGQNIGRYWPQVGPQISLYVPGVYLTQSDYFNQIYVLELDQPGGCEGDEKFGCWVEFNDQPKYVN